MAWTREHLVPPFFATTMVLLFLSCCVTRSAVDNGARASLNMLTAVVDPASKLASQGCDARIDLVVARVETDKDFTASQGKAAIVDIREKCELLRHTFDRIRDLHNQASNLVESERFTEALSALRDAQQQFDELKPLLENP